MGYWGWRPLAAIFVSVWVVGCSATHDEAPTLPPSAPPRVTLTVRVPITPPPLIAQTIPTPTTVPYTSPTPLVYVVQQGDTLLSVARQFGVPVTVLETANPGLDPRSLQIGQMLIIPNPQFNSAGSPILPTPTPLPLPLFPPTCYDLPTNRIVCLGRVENPLRQPIGRVTVWVTLVDRDGLRLAEADAGVEQSVIPAGQSAPYRLLLQADWRDFGGATAALRSAEPAKTASVYPAIEDERGLWVNGRYSLSARLRNPSAQAMRLERAVLTLNNRAGQITGYRVVPLRRILNAGETWLFTTDIQPLTTERDLTHTLFIEAVLLN
ncbi:MAG: LysM peptidoglycan-binding domain-containing protein [Chloroflexi bacterium]|nr:LysM peptidoglycan-binding domain-containing protein [Chloroflexota bacterium]